MIPVPNYVKKELFQDEVVIGKTTNAFQDLYATNLRILNFINSSLWLFGLLGVILNRKSFVGSVEYSNISGMTFKDNRKRTIAAGLFGGLTFIILGIIIVILILSLPDESVHSTAYVGLLFIILGIIFGTLILTRKTQFWQIHLKDKAVQNSSKWRILKDKSTEADKFLNIIKEKAGIEVT